MRPAKGSPAALIQRAVGRSIAKARRALGRARLDDEDVHAARKDLKRARSGLRLLRPLDEAAYRRENARLRDAARQLSGVREHKVLLARIAELLAEEKKPARRRLLLGLRKNLSNARRRDWRALRSGKAIDRIDNALATAAKRVREWRVSSRAGGKAAAATALALRGLYRKGRKAIARTRKEPTDERLHEARKQAKHLAQALEILANGRPSKNAKKVLAHARDVGDYLGDDRDLAVLESRFPALRGDAGNAKRNLRSLLEQRRTRLQKKALRAAGKLFRKRTRRVLRRAALRR